MTGNADMRAKRSLLRGSLTVLMAGLLLSVTAACAESNKWRLQFSGKANSDGVIVLRFTPADGDAITAEISIDNNTGENGVAREVVRALREQLPRDDYSVERDDGEDVLIKKRLGRRDFALEIVSNSVRGVRINPDRE